MYDVDYFIRKFEGIPEEFWCVGDYSDHGKHCAYGHCGMHHGKNEENSALEKVFQCKEGLNIVNINDGGDCQYKQLHPKQRILAALYDIKKLQQPQHANITKQLAILPVDETSDLTLIKSNV